MYRGFLPAMMLTSHGGVQFASYERLKKTFGYKRKFDRKKTKTKHIPSLGDRFASSAGYLAMGAASKIIASTTTYPLQVIKSRLQQRSTGFEVGKTGNVEVFERKYKNMSDCTTKIFRREGLRGFYKGVWVNSLRVAPNSAVTFLVYELVLDWMKVR